MHVRFTITHVGNNGFFLKLLLVVANLYNLQFFASKFVCTGLLCVHYTIFSVVKLDFFYTSTVTGLLVSLNHPQLSPYGSAHHPPILALEKLRVRLAYILFIHVRVDYIINVSLSIRNLHYNVTLILLLILVYMRNLQNGKMFGEDH